MLDIVEYGENSLITLGKSIRHALNYRIGQSIFIYEDLVNVRLALSAYELKRSLYHSIIMFTNIEQYIRFGLDLSKKGINMVSCRLFRVGNLYRMHIVFDIPEQIPSIGKHFYNNFYEIAKEHKIDPTEIYWYGDSNIEKVKNIFTPLIELTDMDRNIPKIATISKNWTIYYNLKDEFKIRANISNEKRLKCIQFADLSSRILTITFHPEYVKKVGVKYLNLPGSFVRLVNVLTALDIEIVTVVSRIISPKYGGIAEDIYALKYPPVLKSELSGLESDELEKKLIEKFIVADAELEKKSIIHKDLIKMHKSLLKKLGSSIPFTFMKEIKVYDKDFKKDE